MSVYHCFLLLGVPAVPDPRGPAADPPEPALGASGGGALCGTGGLHPQQVDWPVHRASDRRLLPLLYFPYRVQVYCCWVSSFSLSFKQEEVEQKAAQNPKGTVMLYRWLTCATYLCSIIIYITFFLNASLLFCRCGDHVLLSAGPLVARTGLCSQYEVTALHNLKEGPRGLHRQAQGLSLPLQLQVGTVMSKHFEHCLCGIHFLYKLVGSANIKHQVIPPYDQALFHPWT